ncbi:hypothetical protein GCM10020331_042630 [Ectobacillus funiculus]
MKNYLKQTAGIGVTFDVGLRKFDFLGTKIGLLYVNGLCDSNLIIHLLDEVIDTNDVESQRDNVTAIFRKTASSISR